MALISNGWNSYFDSLWRKDEMLHDQSSEEFKSERLNRTLPEVTQGWMKAATEREVELTIQLEESRIREAVQRTFITAAMRLHPTLDVQVEALLLVPGGVK